MFGGRCIEKRKGREANERGKNAWAVAECRAERTAPPTGGVEKYSDVSEKREVRPEKDIPPPNDHRREKKVVRESTTTTEEDSRRP